MQCTKLMLAVFVAALAASFMHQASAQWGTGGATTITRKSHLSNLDLFCDLSRPSFGGYTIPAADRLKIVTSPSAASPTAAASLTFSGEVFCAEVLPGQSGLENAQNGLVGRFRLHQRSPAQRVTSTLTQTETGLVFSGPDAAGVRTWRFVVPDPTVFPFPELLYDLVPADADTAAKFCEPHSTNCRALIGLQLPARQSDYPERDIDGLTGNDLALGEVFRFTTRTTSGIEAPERFYWGPCHSQAFGTPGAVHVDAFLNASFDGVGQPTGVTLTEGFRVAILANQNDLWSIGRLSNTGPRRWTNADGLVHEMVATGHDDSGAAAGTDIGDNHPVQLAGDGTHMLHRFDANRREWVVADSAPYGTLVGSVDGINFYIFGNAFDGPAPTSGPLKLYQWDRPRGDNTQFITATVAAESIQCRVVVNDQLIQVAARGNTRGERRVEVEGFPTLNVGNKSRTANFPFAVLGCSEGDAAITFAPDGSPIVVGNSVLVNNRPVAIRSFTVGDKVSRPSCDGGQALDDLQLQLNRLDFINAVAPNGVCQNGHNLYVVTVGQGTFYGGEDTVELSGCN